jgi:hypothetical protein
LSTPFGASVGGVAADDVAADDFAANDVAADDVGDGVAVGDSCDGVSCSGFVTVGCNASDLCAATASSVDTADVRGVASSRGVTLVAASSGESSSEGVAVDVDDGVTVGVAEDRVSHGSAVSGSASASLRSRPVKVGKAAGLFRGLSDFF